MIKCGICHQNIYIFYYKGKCKCKVYYHFDCVKHWYSISKTCIYCREIDKTNFKNIIYKNNKIIESVIILSIFSFILLILLYLKINSISHY